MAAATVQVNVRLEPGRYNALKGEAQRQGRTITAVIDEAVECYLAIVTPPRGKGKTT